jgi:hypothetical protein
MEKQSNIKKYIKLLIIGNDSWYLSLNPILQTLKEEYSIEFIR